jgi:hypothetical protein
MLGLGFTLIGAGLGGIVSYFYFTKNYKLMTKQEAEHISKVLAKHLNK